jgi:hypothetical protein
MERQCTVKPSMKGKWHDARREGKLRIYGFSLLRDLVASLQPSSRRLLLVSNSTPSDTKVLLYDAYTEYFDNRYSSAERKKCEKLIRSLKPVEE